MAFGRGSAAAQIAGTPCVIATFTQANLEYFHGIIVTCKLFLKVG